MAKLETKEETTQIQVTVTLANELKTKMKVGDTYDTVIKRLLKGIK